MRYALGCCEEEVVQVNGETNIKFTGPCFMTGKPYSVTVPVSAIIGYKNGKHIRTCC